MLQRGSPTFRRFQQVPDEEGRSRSDILTFESEAFLWIRKLLRLMSLWRPKSAKWFEVWLYPVLVNMLLFGVGPILDIVHVTGDKLSLSIFCVYFVQDMSIWLGHIFAYFYFRRKYLEKNVLRQVKQRPNSIEHLNGKLTRLGKQMSASFFLLFIAYFGIYITIHISRSQGSEQFSSNVPANVHGTLDVLFFIGGIIFLFYYAGVGLALAWTMGLLYVCLTSKLKALRDVYLKWDESVLDAINLFQLQYSQMVEHSWKRISWWFLSHNLVVVTLPLYGYELAMAIGGGSYHPKRLPQTGYFFLFALITWLAPILIAEKIRWKEENFLQEINDFCPHLRKHVHGPHSSQQGIQSQPPNVPNSSQQESPNHGSSNFDEQSQTADDNYTLTTRGDDFEKFLKFLERRRTGMVPLGYTWQLNISKISIFLGIITFLINVHRVD